MKNSILFLSIFFLSSVLCFSQGNQFQRTRGGSTNDGAKWAGIWNPALQSLFAGYIGVNQSDFDIAKYNSDGSLAFGESWGGAQFDQLNGGTVLSDGTIVVCGQTNSFGLGIDASVTGLSFNGTLLWGEAIGGTAIDVANSIISATGGMWVSGTTSSFGAGNSDIWIVALNPDGTYRWSRTIGGTGNETGGYVAPPWAGKLTTGASTNSSGAGNYDMYIIRIDTNGNSTSMIQWTKTVGGTGNDQCNAIVVTTDGGTVFAGFTNSFGAGNYDIYIGKLDANGSLLWTRTVGGPGYEYAYSIIQTTDGGYAVAGSTDSYGAGLSDMYIVKLDAAGNLQWSKTVGGSSSDGASCIIQTADGGYAVAGFTYSYGAGLSDMFLVKFDANWNTCTNNTSSPSSTSGTGGTLGTPTPTITTPNPTVTPVSAAPAPGGTVTSICTFIGIQPISNELPNSYELEQNYPNPFNPATKIKFDIPETHINASLRIYDILGREIVTLVNEELNAGTYEIEWNASNYPSGIYFYKLITGEFSQTRKAVLIK